MAMAVDTRQQPAPFGSMGYDAMRYPPPQFTNPWVSSPASNQGQMYATSLPSSSIGSDLKHYTAQAPSVSAAYSGGHLPAPSLATDVSASRPYGASYTTSAATSGSTFAPTSAPQYSSSYGYPADRRSSHAFGHTSEAERQSFSDALDASRGMVAMSQSDITPRNIYGNTGPTRGSTDSYGFPSSHSSHSSISSASTYPTYYNSSVSEASVGDYSSASESVDMPSSRTLPRPNGLIGGNLPPAPQSMMGQFSSKVSSSSQKKHKCKICDKRFTRPSSLQTHMYSHTGEKPFACDVDGCGRHFSVVSNLRRHRKVHKGEGHDHPSPDDED